MTRGRWIGWIGLVLVLVVFLWRLWPAETGPGAPTRSPVVAPAPESDDRPRATRGREVTGPAAPDAPSETPAPPAGFEGDADGLVRLTVTVLRGDGSPAAGATVVVVDPHAADDWRNELGRATADTSGVAVVDLAPILVRVMAWLDGEACATTDLIDFAKRGAVTVRLEAAVVVRGRVVHPGGEPAPGVEVQAWVQPWFKGIGMGLQITSRTDDAGRFAFPPIARAGIDALNPPYVYARGPGAASGHAEADTERLDAELVVRLEPGFTIRGRFVDDTGQPEYGAVLHAVAGTDHPASGGEDGRFTLRLERGTYRLTATCVYPRSRLWVPPESTRRFVGRSLGTRDGGAGDVDLGDVVLPKGRPVAGRVVDPAGAASSGAEVALFLDDRRIWTVTADGDGRFAFDEVGDDPHRLYVREVVPEESDATHRTATVDGVRGGDAEVRVVLEPLLVVSMRFLSATDRTPVGTTQIGVKAFRHGEKLSCVGQEVTDTDPMDSFAIGVPAAGSYDVEVALAGFEPQRFESVEVVEGRETKLDVLLRKKPE